MSFQKWNFLCYPGKRLKKLLFITLIVINSIDAEDLDLNAIYALALRHSEDVKIKASEVAIAEARYRETLASYYPQLALFARSTQQSPSSNRTDSTLTDLLLGRTPTLENRNTNSSNTSSFTRYDVGGLSLAWPLFTGLRSYHEGKAARDARDAARFNEKRFRELLYQDLARLFYQNLEYDKAILLFKDEERTLRLRIYELARRLNLGRSRDGEVLNARAELLTVQTDLKSQEHLRQSAREMLSFLTGRPAESLKLKDSQLLPAREDLNRYLETTPARSDLQAARSLLKSKEMQSKAEKGGHLPRLDLQAEGYAYQQPTTGRDWRFTLGITLPIFEGGATVSRVRLAQEEVKTRQLELKKLERLADFETRLAYSAFVTAMARKTLLDQAVRIARQAYAVQLRDYELGAGSALEVFDALRRFHSTRRNHLRAETELRLEHIQLQIAAGRTGNMHENH
ncbi:MAG: TolC family protein [Spirochaetales bacterium]|nr:TolC family protein [Spirochaetales bacterium]